MPRFLLLKITLAWMLLTAAPLSAKVFTFTELNCHCEVPDTWVFQDTPDELVHVIDMEHARSFELLVKPVSRAITLDSKEFLSGFDQALIPQGFVPQDHREVVLDGIKFHEIHLTKDLGNKTLNYCAYITLADGYGYNIRIEAYNVDPEQDDELKAMVQSFAFIKPPKIHRGFSYWDMFNPPDPAQHDATSLANYRAGVTLGILAVLAIGLTIAVGITYGISSLEKEDEPASSSSSASTGTPAVPKPAEETKSIHILMTDGQQVVHEVGQVREMLQGGVLTPETFFWMEGMPEWRPLQELPPRRVATVVPPRRTGGASSSSPQSMQPTVLSQATTTPEILAPSSAVASVENETHSYQFRLIHRERFCVWSLPGSTSPWFLAH